SRRAPYLFTGWFWYLVTLIPVIGLIQVGSQAMADRYMYFPLTGLSIGFVWGGWEVLKRTNGRSGIAAVVLVVTSVLLARATTKQLSYWQNSVTLFRRALSVTSNNGIAEGNLSSALLSKNE